MGHITDFGWFKAYGTGWISQDILDYSGMYWDMGETPRKETVMATTYAYEIVVAETRDKDGKVDREARLVAHEEHLLKEPTREDLLMKYAQDIRDLDVFAKEVSVNIRPFCTE